jgi:hypothetical protein
MLHLRLVMLPQQLHVGVVVHPLWSLGKWLHHVRASTELLSDLLRPSESPVTLLLALALVAQVVAVAAQEVLPRPVQLRHPPAAPDAVNHSRQIKQTRVPPELSIVYPPSYAP